MNDVELPPEVGDSVGQRAVELAQAVCADAALYGGHACLVCQQVARHLVGLSRDGAWRWPVPSTMVLPPHGTSLKASQSHWEVVLSSLREEAQPSE